MIEETLDKSVNKNTFIYVLVLLSNSTFEAKRIFKNLFNKIILTPKDLYKFMELCKKERGFGQIIRTTVKFWFKSHDSYHIERMFIEYRSGYGWTGRDIMRMIRPIPTTNQEKLLYAWLAKSSVVNPEEFKELRFVYAFEKMRLNKAKEKEIVEFIKKLKFNNAMIPGNIKRTENIVNAWLENFETSEKIPFVNIVKYSSMNISFKKLFCLLPEVNTRISLLTLMTAYLKLKSTASSSNEIKSLDDFENLLLKEINKNYNNNINILDTSDNMFQNYKIDNILVPPAVISSILIGKSKNIIDFYGNLLSEKRTSRSILEAEEISCSISSKFNYNKIFEAINSIESNLIVLWGNSFLDLDKFIKEFNLWKQEKQRVIKMVFINFGKPRNISSDCKEIVTINDKTEKLLKLIKSGEI